MLDSVPCLVGGGERGIKKCTPAAHQLEPGSSGNFIL